MLALPYWQTNGSSAARYTKRPHLSFAPTSFCDYIVGIFTTIELERQHPWQRVR